MRPVRNPRIMIPAKFGLAIGNSVPVGHAVGHNRMSGCTAFRVSVAFRAQQVASRRRSR
jgi:hypothetical protein